MLHSQWMQVLDSPYLRMNPDHESLRELEWWASRANLTVGRPFLRPDRTMMIVTDASMEGWGRPPRRLGDLRPVVVRPGPNTTSTGSSSRAVWLTLQHFLPQVRDTAVDVLTDNSTTVAYINKEGGTQSPTLCYLALDLWGLVQATRGSTWLPTTYRESGTSRRTPLSRGKHNHPTEWSPPQDSGRAHIRALADSPCGSLRIGEESQTSGVPSQCAPLRRRAW